MNDIGKREHVINHSQIRCVVGAFDKSLHKVYIWTVTGAVLSSFLHKSIYLQFVHHGTKLYDKYRKYDDRNKYINDDGSGIFPKLNVINLDNAKYHATYDNNFFVLNRNYIKGTRIHWVYSGRKTKGYRFCEH